MGNKSVEQNNVNKLDWILHKKETRRHYSNATWVPLRAYNTDKNGDIHNVGYINEYFGCGSVAIYPEHRNAAEQLNWRDIGLGRNVEPGVYEDGYYSIEQFLNNEKEQIGVHLVFDHPQPVIGGRVWILNPDLVVALRLVKDGLNWIRPEENFDIVVRETFNAKGQHSLIEIKREYLLDYLAARKLHLRLSYYRQRTENVSSLETSPYVNLIDQEELRDGGKFKLSIRSLESIFGGSWASCRIWRTDIDEDDDAPVMGPVNDDNTSFEKTQGYLRGNEGICIDGEFWREEWIDHQGQSIRVRGDIDKNLPLFIVETDGTRMLSADLNDTEIGRWLWFHPSVVNELLNLRGFSLKWYTAETGGIKSTSGNMTHFGINTSDLITVYAYDIACLSAWEQRVWAAHNVVPDGKLSNELYAAQIIAEPANTRAVEDLFFEVMKMLEIWFKQEFNISIYTHDIEDDSIQHISRFTSKDQASLLRLAKELVRAFSDRLNVRELRKLSKHKEKEKLGSNKLLQDILAVRVGEEKAYQIFSPIVGVYDMRVGDAHPTGSNIREAIKLAGIDVSKSFLRQGEKLISNLGQSIWWIGKLLFTEKGNEASK